MVMQNTNRTTPIQPLRKRPLRCDSLQRTARNVVRRRVPQHILQCILFSDIAPRLADYNAQLGLVVACPVLRAFRDRYRRWIWIR